MNESGREGAGGGVLQQPLIGPLSSICEGSHTKYHSWVTPAIEIPFLRDFPGGPVVENLSVKARDEGSKPGIEFRSQGIQLHMLRNN